MSKLAGPAMGLTMTTHLGIIMTPRLRRSTGDRPVDDARAGWREKRPGAAGPVREEREP